MKKLLLLFALLGGLSSLATAQNLSAGSTYLYEPGDGSWVKINTGMWMGETWLRLSVSQVPEQWFDLLYLENESTPPCEVYQLSGTESKMCIKFSEESIQVSALDGSALTVFRLYERFGERVDH
ncbi:MAG: hypothetical protein HC913_14180 [Microscillaceae bacterium]|nr:hypothetical protein [Microscillaceae bacterium]